MHEPSGAQTWGTRLKRSVTHVGKALSYSLSGLVTAVRLSLAFRQEVLVLAALCAILALTGKSGKVWLLCIGCWLLVMVGELLNSALEEALDLITRDFSLGVKYAKDMASAAVFLLVMFNILLWLYLFGSDLLVLLSLK